MTRALLALAVGGVLATGPPSPDIVSAAHRLAPKGARIVLARELDASFGVVAYELHGTTTAVALRWTDRSWRRARAGQIRMRLLEPRPSSTIARAPTYVHARIRTGDTGRIDLWLDGKELRPLGHPRDGWFDLYDVVKNPRPGRHSVIAFASGGENALAGAWTFRVR